MNEEATQDGKQQAGQPAKPKQTITGRLMPLAEAFTRAFAKAHTQ